MILNAIKLWKNNSGQQFRKEYIRCSTIFEVRGGVATPGNHSHLNLFKSSLNLFISHFPLLVFLGNLVKRVLKHVSKKPLVTDLQTSPETRPNRILA